jgi:hypothetical protein
VQGRALSMIEIVRSQFVRKWRLEGHGFSRAEKSPKQNYRGFSPILISHTHRQEQ